MPYINEFNNEYEEWLVDDNYIFEVSDTDIDGVAEQVVIRNIETGNTLVLQDMETDMGRFVFIYVWSPREELDNLKEPNRLVNTFLMKVRYEHMEDLLVMDRLREIFTVSDVEKYIGDIIVRVGNLIPGEFKALMELYLMKVM